MSYNPDFQATDDVALEVIEVAETLIDKAQRLYGEEFVMNTSLTTGCSCYIRKKRFDKYRNWRIRVSDHPSRRKERKLFSFDYKNKDDFNVALLFLSR